DRPWSVLESDFDDPTGVHVARGGHHHLNAVVACYGYCELITFVPTAGSTQVVGATTISDGFVYDPTFVFSTPNSNTALALHGYGAGLVAINLTTAAIEHCPIPEGADRTYGLFGYPILGSVGSTAFVVTKVGNFEWKFGNYFKPVTADVDRVIHWSQTWTVCLREDGRVIANGTPI
ncbi:MAG: hypothetical protein AAFQ82_24945, partial [Myxococcota bacterium]